MVCSRCGKKRVLTEKDYDIMGNYKYLSDRQIKARLALFKKHFCRECPKRYDCDYPMYKKCKSK